MQLSVYSTPTTLNGHSRDVVRTGCFVDDETENGLSTSSKDGGSSSLGMVGRSSRKSGSVVWTLFSRFCRYSVHLSRISSLFLIKSPSILLTGCK